MLQKHPLKHSFFFKNNLKTVSVNFFFLNFENLIKFYSLVARELDLFIKELFWVGKTNATFFRMPRVSLEYLMRFSKIEKKKTESVFKLFLKNWVSKGFLPHYTVAMATVGILQKPF